MCKANTTILQCATLMLDRSTGTSASRSSLVSVPQYSTGRSSVNFNETTIKTITELQAKSNSYPSNNQ